MSIDLWLNEEGKFERLPKHTVEIFFDTPEEKERWLWKQERYVWHDLRKNPDDVPDEPYEPVLVAIDIGCGEVDYDIFCYEIDNWSARMVIAWKHIEPCEEE